MESIEEEEFITKLETYDGQITIFEEKKRLTCFEGKINSLECLNQETVWDLDYFKRLRLVLSSQQKDCKYLFSAEHDDSEEQKTFKVNVVLTTFSKAEVTWFKVKVSVNTSSKMFTFLVEKNKSINEKQRKKNKNLEKELELERKQKIGLINEIDKILKMKRDMEQHCYEVFSKELNSKKEKISKFKKLLNERQAQFRTEALRKAPVINVSSQPTRNLEEESNFFESQLGFGGPLFENTQNYRPVLSSLNQLQVSNPQRKSPSSSQNTSRSSSVQSNKTGNNISSDDSSN